MTKATMIACIFVTLLMGTASARAQTPTATSFEQLRILIQPGDSITLTDRAGMRISGKVRSLSDTSLEMDFGRERRAFIESDVTTIRQRRGDSLANGALWGLGVGAAIGTAAAIMVGLDCYGGGNCAAVAAGAIGAYGAIGAGIGVGIDALMKSKKVVYQSKSTTRLNVTPLLTARSKGVILSVDF
jgi:hypothetical protein